MTSVALYTIPGHKLSNQTCAAMEQGIRASGARARSMRLEFYRDGHAQDYDAAVFWGYIETCQKVMRDFRAAGKPVIYIDQGYWGRGKNGHFKVAVNARHPNAYFQKRPHRGDRARALGVTAKPWTGTGGHILVAGMSAKAAWAEKLEPVESFERSVIDAIRKVTDRPIVYRPKPSWKDAKPIEGIEYSAPDEPLAKALDGCHAVVTHHSNVAVDGLVEGIPCFVWDGVAMPMGSSDLRMIDKPLRPEGREQWVADTAWTQFTMDEMRRGLPWRHFKDEGLV